MFSWDLLGRRARNWLSGEAGRARWWGLAAGEKERLKEDVRFVLEKAT